jgi:hypothetical protein
MANFIKVLLLWALVALLASCDGSRSLPSTTAAKQQEHVVHVRATARPPLPAEAAAALTIVDGSAASPFPTVEAARDHLRALRAAGEGGDRTSYRVLIGSGTYAPLRLEPEDSGSPGHPVIYEADRSDGPVVISAGTQVPKDAFRQWSGHPGIVKADLSSLHLDFGSIAPGSGCGGDCTGFKKASLVFSNRSMVLARWPNIDGTTGKQVWEKIKIGGANGFSVKDPAAVARMAKWGSEAEQAWLHSYPLFAWEDSWDRFKVSASTTEVNVTIKDPYPYSQAIARSGVNDNASSGASTWDGGGGGGVPVPTTGVWVIKIGLTTPGGYPTPTVFCNGTAHSRFRVLKVTAGGRQDPLGGECKGFKVLTQVGQKHIPV